MATPGEIATLMSKADSAIQSAVAFIKGAADVPESNVALEDMNTFYEKWKVYEYETLLEDIKIYLTGLTEIIAAVPVEPPQLGNFVIVDPPTFIPVDLTMLRTSLDGLLATIATLPDRITNAVALADALYTLLLNDIQNGGYGITVADELALFNRTRDKETLTASATIDELRNKSVALGYQVPPGALEAAIRKAITTGAQNISETNREIYDKRADLYRENRKFSIQQAQAVSQFLVDFTTKKGELLQLVASAKLEEAKLAVQQFLGELQAWEGKLNKVIKEQDLYGKILELRTDVWGKRVEGQSTVVNAVNMSNQTQANIKNAIGVLQLDELKLAFEKEKNDILNWLEKVKAIGQVYSQACGSIYGAVNGIVSYIVESTED